jgi:hypothetical protein
MTVPPPPFSLVQRSRPAVAGVAVAVTGPVAVTLGPAP